MSKLETKIPTDTWIVATWDEYIQAIEKPEYEKAKGYYHNGRMRIEMSPVGNDHASDHTIIIVAVSIYAARPCRKISPDSSFQLNQPHIVRAG